MAEQQAPQRVGREGGRWINQRPTPDEFATWFNDSMKIDPALEVKDYIGGVVLIPAVDTKARQVTGFTGGKPIIEVREELIYTPYAKVETRIDYFWDLVGVHDDWVAVVEKVTPPRLPIEPQIVKETSDESRNILTEYSKPGGLATLVHQLPEGFSVMSVPVGEGYAHFLLCTVRAAIYRADEDGNAKGMPLREGVGTKQVPLVKSYNSRTYADDSSLMKAETGALGRALGFAGIFVIPGSGIATAEDMMEALSQGEVPAQVEPSTGPAAPAEPPVRTGQEETQDEQQQLAAKAKVLYDKLREDHPESAEEFGRWAHQRRITKLSDAKGAALRGVVSRLEKLTAEAEARTQQQVQAPAEGELSDEHTSETAEEGSDGEPSAQAG